MYVPATVRIRRNRATNMPTDRLFRRRAYLVRLVIFDGGRSLPTRSMFVDRAAELTAIESALIARSALPANMRAHMIHADFGGFL